MTDKEFEDYWDHLVEKKGQSANAALSSDERIFFAVNFFRGQVPRSGLDSYFKYTEPDVILDAHQGLATLGLPEVLRLLEQAQAIFSSGVPLPETDELVTLSNDDLPEEERLAMNKFYGEVFEVEDQLYLQDQVIFDSLCRFADERRLLELKG